MKNLMISLALLVSVTVSAQVCTGIVDPNTLSIGNTDCSTFIDTYHNKTYAFVSGTTWAETGNTLGSGTTNRAAMWNGTTLADFPLTNTGTQVNQTQTTGLGLASGTTAQRDPAAPTGTIRYNSELFQIEAKLAGSWFRVETDPVAEGTVATTPDGSGDVTITHGLGQTPALIQLTAKGTTTPYLLSWHAETGTTFKIRVLDASVTPPVIVTAGTVEISWQAKVN